MLNVFLLNVIRPTDCSTKDTSILFEEILQLLTIETFRYIEKYQDVKLRFHKYRPALSYNTSMHSGITKELYEQLVEVEVAWHSQKSSEWRKVR